MGYVNLGTRNKGTFWEYGAAYSFLHTQLPKTRFAIPQFLGIGEGPANKHCHHTDVIETAKQTYQEEFAAGLYTQEFFAEVQQGYLDAYNELVRILPAGLSALDSQELAVLFSQVSINIMQGHKPMLFGLFSTYLDDTYTHLLKKTVGEADVEEVKSILLTTSVTSFGQQEEDSIFSIEQTYLEQFPKISKESFTDFCKKPEIRQHLDSLVEDFGWFHMEYASEPMTRPDYEAYLWERLVTSRKLSDHFPSEVRAEIMQKQQRFFAEHPEATELKEWTRVLQELATILDDSKVVTVKGIHRANDLFVEVGKRLGISRDELLYLTFPEVSALLKAGQKADPSLIAERKKHRVILLENGTINVYQGEAAATMAAKLLPEEASTAVQEVKGIIAYPGKVTGRVCVINTVTEKDKFKPGDILVTRDGTVELTVFLREAAAIVTDEGGMICHAAIVAREMKTPCIVGTRKATKVFKDGDMVEVDANTGIVRKIG